MSQQIIIRMPLRSEVEYKEFKQLESVLVMQGRDVSEFFSDMVRRGYDALGGDLGDREIVDGERLIKEAFELFGKKMARHHLMILRENYWTQGIEFFVAPQGERKLIRYDLELCREGLEKFDKIGRKKKRVVRKRKKRVGKLAK